MLSLILQLPFSLFSHVLDSIKGYMAANVALRMDGGRFRKVVSFCKLATREETGNLKMVQLGYLRG